MVRQAEGATMAVTIYHNPRCGKSRAALKLLEGRGLRPTVVEYLKTPPSAAELKRILKLLGLPARALLRSKEKEYRTAGLDNAELGEDKIVAAMVRHPILIERPIVIAGNKAALGRPPEAVLKIL
jgi:arsenate reductase (glutaredoxin)